ncbi:unnamed protein product [Oikopleura dioica]|uniref:Uncharacterized protein n=1 Tax=Oikopleura dioica TaxID=34765 RepID=E4WWU7_OIKDI|nr:unnamed protein product [Oikopleura dioica]
MSMQGKRQFSWQPTLIDDWATEPADEAKPLPVDNNEENLERKNENDPKGFLKRKQALFHQAAIDFQEEDSVPNEVFSPAQPAAPKKTKSFQSGSNNPVFFDQIPECGRTLPDRVLSENSSISLSSTPSAHDEFISEAERLEYPENLSFAYPEDDKSDKKDSNVKNI